ncbi:AbrB/MazE/SpoVT family DNA-binding domain-containing protein [Iningainema tapete]|uniref:Type II toxin-antitoxin system PrlF family antitoxin n=1 Tax=Iningainema tapete BLCC-T55 TaxID=2748662 RepID=A0A8J6XL70_9CYAN|nr:type II toxin-antitoxin system PrlF family antitoxin [Iningainema tapete]MBD2778344.1 type II toxin-antitoxin system PrlF family antitoxin [Iningainema tapete BLCC-T55]
MPTATITTKGQTTIPKEIRDYLQINPGDQIDFIIEEDGRVIVQPATIKVQELKGILHREGMKSISVEEMNAAVRKRAAKNE